MPDPIRLYLLRHGEVLSHRGDVPITEAAEEHAASVGRSLVAGGQETFFVLSGETKRAKDTAHHLVSGIHAAGGHAVGPTVAFALRNPDLYLGGVRVNMVSSHEALAEQVDGMATEDVEGLDFYPQFITEKDRIGWWLRHESPPGEGATDIATRIRAFARSFTNPHRPELGDVVAVTHSPLLRAVALDTLGDDIGEPPWVSGLLLEIMPDTGDVSASLFPDPES